MVYKFIFILIKPKKKKKKKLHVFFHELNFLEKKKNILIFFFLNIKKFGFYLISVRC